MENSQLQKINPCLWFDTQAEEAAIYYTSIFKDSRINKVVKHGEGGAGPEGAVLVVDFQIFGQKFTALNGGPLFKFNESVSFVVNCDSQEEVDTYWDKLTEDGEESMCGWLKDKYGVSWQIIPRLLGQLLADNDKEKANRAMQAMLQMRKIDTKKLLEACGATTV